MGELDGVVDEVVDDLPDVLLVDRRAGGAGVEGGAQADALVLRRLLPEHGGVLEQARQARVGAHDLGLVALDLRHVEEVVDDDQERAARLVGDADAGAVRVRLAHVAQDHLGHADDPVERRADLVAGRGQEAHPRLVRPDELLVGEAELVVGGGEFGVHVAQGLVVAPQEPHGEEARGDQDEEPRQERDHLDVAAPLRLVGVGEPVAQRGGGEPFDLQLLAREVELGGAQGQVRRGRRRVRRLVEPPVGLEMRQGARVVRAVISARGEVVELAVGGGRRREILPLEDGADVGQRARLVAARRTSLGAHAEDEVLPGALAGAPGDRQRLGDHRVRLAEFARQDAHGGDVGQDPHAQVVAVLRLGGGERLAEHDERVLVSAQHLESVAAVVPSDHGEAGVGAEGLGGPLVVVDDALVGARVVVDGADRLEGDRLLAGVARLGEQLVGGMVARERLARPPGAARDPAPRQRQVGAQRRVRLGAEQRVRAPREAARLLGPVEAQHRLGLEPVGGGERVGAEGLPRRGLGEGEGSGGVRQHQRLGRRELLGRRSGFRRDGVCGRRGARFDRRVRQRLGERGAVHAHAHAQGRDEGQEASRSNASHSATLPRYHPPPIDDWPFVLMEGAREVRARPSRFRNGRGS